MVACASWSQAQTSRSRAHSLLGALLSACLGKRLLRSLTNWSFSKVLDDQLPPRVFDGIFMGRCTPFWRSRRFDGGITPLFLLAVLCVSLVFPEGEFPFM